MFSIIISFLHICFNEFKHFRHFEKNIKYFIKLILLIKYYFDSGTAISDHCTWKAVFMGGSGYMDYRGI